MLNTNLHAPTSDGITAPNVNMHSAIRQEQTKQKHEGGLGGGRDWVQKIYIKRTSVQQRLASACGHVVERVSPFCVKGLWGLGHSQLLYCLLESSAWCYRGFDSLAVCL